MILLKPQDVLVLLKLSLRDSSATLAQLGSDLGMSASEVHGAMRRASAAALLDFEPRRPRVASLLEFLEHGIRYVFVSEPGRLTRGVPTAHSAPPLNQLIASMPSGHIGRILREQGGDGYGDGIIGQMASNMSNLVWPDPEGTVRGEGLEPLYPSAVSAARKDPRLYESLALVDAIRVGRARERALAIKLLRERMLQT